VNSTNKHNKPILDPCCGGKMFWFDKQNPNVEFCDIRTVPKEIVGIGKNAREFEVSPDTIADFTALPFDDESFWHIVFDPPHIIHGGDNSWIIKKYGRLKKDWQSVIRAGFDECWRVLKPNGTLIFKWNETDITVTQIIKCIGHEPIYGHKSGKLSKTHWLAFVKV